MTNAVTPTGEPKIDLQKAVSSLDDLVKLALECEKKELVDPTAIGDIQTGLALIKQVVDVIHEAYLKTLQEMGMTESDAERIRADLSKFSEPEKKVFEKLSGLQKQCEDARSRIYESLQANRTTLKQLEKEIQKGKGGTKKKRRSRKQQGRSKWMKT